MGGTDRAPAPSPFVPSGFFVLRTPLLPVEEWLAWLAQPDGADSAAWLRAAFKTPELRDALYIASPTLLAAVEGNRADKALPKLAAYLSRAATRSTPFGLFAGCSVGTFGGSQGVPATQARTDLTLGPRTAYRRHTRLDNDYLFALIAALEADPRVRPRLVWRSNSSLYRTAGRWRYAEARLSGTLRSYHLVAVDDTDALRETLRRADSGAREDELARPLVDEDVTMGEAQAFVEELIDAQLLVSDLALQVTGSEPADALVERLAMAEETRKAAEVLDEVRSALAKIDAAGPGASPEDYEAVLGSVEPLGVPAEPARLFQVDMVKPAAGLALPPIVAEELARAVAVLHRLAGRPSPDDPLVRFRDEFRDRYDDREVPLAEALDEEVGIGFGSDPLDETAPLLEGIELPTEGEPPSRWTKRGDWLLARLVEAVGEGRDEIRLTDADLGELEESDRPPLPDAVELIATIVAPSADAVDRGEFRVVVHGVNGAPGVRLLGRFCHADENLHALVAQHLRQEESRRPEAAFAEIVHLAEGRLGNILCRPVLRDHEIPFLGRSGAPAEAQLPVSDLLVSVQDGRVVLRSCRLDREVLPRLTTAHNFGLRSLGVYRFLCSLQSQGVVAGLGWSWGPLMSSPFLPRVTYGRLVLARARWTLRGNELTDLPRGRLPRYVALDDGDNELACDLDSPASRAALIRQLHGRSEAILVELLPSPDELCVTGPEGRFLHELVVPFVSAAPTDAGPIRSLPRRQPDGVQRRFPPGSEWLYAKLYTGTATADSVLVDAVRPLVDESLAHGLADGWFFIRYRDPDGHLRVRLHGEAAAILPLLHDAVAPLLADGRVARLELGTYEREVERYGGDAGMELSEQVFRHDSDAVLDIVELLSGDEGLDARWRLALAGTDRLLDDFGLTLEEKLEWTAGRRRSFGTEFRVDGTVAGQLGRRYRTERPALEELLAAAAAADGDGADHALAPGLAILAQRSEAVAPIAAELKARGLPVGALVASYAHMHANRLLRAAHRAQELVLHDLLHRLYQARAHRRP